MHNLGRVPKPWRRDRKVDKMTSILQKKWNFAKSEITFAKKQFFVQNDIIL